MLKLTKGCVALLNYFSPVRKDIVQSPKKHLIITVINFKILVGNCYFCATYKKQKTSIWTYTNTKEKKY